MTADSVIVAGDDLLGLLVGRADKLILILDAEAWAVMAQNLMQLA